jgi:hypothetical protein
MSQPNRIVLTVLCLAWACLAAAQTVDCLAAVVNGQALTLTDVLIAEEFRLFPRAAEVATGDARAAVLDALIDQKVVLELSRESGPVDPARVEEALTGIHEALGGEAFGEGLAKFGLVEADLRPYLEDRLRFERAVAIRFAVRTPVSARDVDTYYRDVYAPERRSQGLEPEPLTAVRARIEARVEQAARADKIAEWIKNLRRQADVRINRDCLERRQEGS